MIRSRIIVSAWPAAAINVAVPALAQSSVRRYPDPGHRWLGVYAGGPGQYFDYDLRKISLSDSFPDKPAWWAVLKSNRTGQDDGHRHDVVIWSISTQGRHDGPLRLDVPQDELAGRQEFDIHVALSSSRKTRTNRK